MGEFRKLFGIDPNDDSEEIISKVFAGFLISMLIVCVGLLLIMGIIGLAHLLGWWLILVILSLPILFGIFYWVGHKSM
jgi:1,4-dihydroxy-2-naphthoate octaprenyltransferase